MCAHAMTKTVHVLPLNNMSNHVWMRELLLYRSGERSLLCAHSRVTVPLPTSSVAATVQRHALIESQTAAEVSPTGNGGIRISLCVLI